MWFLVHWGFDVFDLPLRKRSEINFVKLWSFVTHFEKHWILRKANEPDFRFLHFSCSQMRPEVNMKLQEGWVIYVHTWIRSFPQGVRAFPKRRVTVAKGLISQISVFWEECHDIEKRYAVHIYRYALHISSEVNSDFLEICSAYL